MSLTLGTAADSQIATGVAGVAWLIELDFGTGTQRFVTWPTDVTVGGSLYQSKAVTVQGVTESEDTAAQNVTLSVTPTDSTVLGLVVGSVANYRNKRVRLYLQLFDATGAAVSSKILRFTGRMDPARIKRVPGADGGVTGRVELPCVRSGMPYARNYQGLRHTHAQQLVRFPGNLVLQYMGDLIEKPTLWLSKRFQEV